jgi:4-hydroxyphenylpyruvate dioxygenase
MMSPRVRRSIATVSLSGTLDEKLAAAALAGFDGVEIFENDLISCRLAPAEIRSLATDLRLEIMLYQPFRDYEAVPDERLAANLRRAERKFAVMTALGADTLLVCSNVSQNAIDDDSRAAAQLRRLADLAAQYGIRIAFEALAWGSRVSSYAHAYRIVLAADHPHLGVCLDSFHILSLLHDPAPIRNLRKEKIFFLQLADAPLLPMDALPWSRHYRCFPGQGDFDLSGFMADVLASGYQGPWSLEVFNDVFRETDAERVARDGMRSLRALEESVAGLAPTGGVPSPVSAGVSLASLPGPARLDGYAFVELAVDGLRRQATERVLHGLGFSRRGRHRSKPVDLWQQAGIRILLNRSDPDGGGLAHGDVTVSAIAVESADPGQSASRAKALLAPPIPRSREPGEADITAAAAPDGTAVFFCRTYPGSASGWLSDFQASAPSPAGDSPLITSVDHVALSQPFDGFDEATLFFQAVLGLRPQGNEEVASPYGLIRSRAMRAGDSVRLVLNVPLLGGGKLPETTSSQHVAFACTDILAVARAVRSAGTPVLPMPGNYYEDLVARWGLDATQVAPLREYGVLYDRDEHGGEFFHFYTAMLGRHLFFEVVQRDHGYDGYGAVNTAVRMAAQLSYAVTGGLYLG